MINSDTSIGTNVTIMQGVTIGGTQKGVPVIEDDSIICANATVLVGIRVGRGAVVVAGSVVVKDVPEHTNVAGNLARELTRRTAPRMYFSLPPNLR